MATGKKTLTLKQFEKKYSNAFLATGEKYKASNIFKKFESNYQDAENAGDIKNALRKLDQLSNVQWRLAHYKSAVRYLQRDPDIIAATGGTNWQKFLPPRFQRVIFYPALWSEAEMADWGKNWVEEVVFKNKK